MKNIDVRGASKEEVYEAYAKQAKSMYIREEIWKQAESPEQAREIYEKINAKDNTNLNNDDNE